MRHIPSRKTVSSSVLLERDNQGAQIEASAGEYGVRIHIVLRWEAHLESFEADDFVRQAVDVVG